MSGNVPVRPLDDRLRLLRPDGTGTVGPGTLPVSMLFEALIDVSADKVNSDDGKLPVKLLLDKSTVLCESSRRHCHNSHKQEIFGRESHCYRTRSIGLRGGHHSTLVRSLCSRCPAHLT